MLKTWFLRTTVALLLPTSIALAQNESVSPTATPAPPTLESQLRELQQRVSTLETEREKEEGALPPASEELTKLKLDLLLPDMLTESFTGLGPGASKVYFSKYPLSVGGYGEVHYTSEQNGPRRTNLARLNPIIGYRFSKTLILNTGLSFQNGGAVEGRGAAEVEFAYLDFLLGDQSGIRAGHVLVPFGLLNLRFEPTQFPMVNRMSAEQTIVPTTWHENGVLGFGKIGSVHVQGGILNSGDASKFEGTTWIRQGRQSGRDARAENPAGVLRAEIVEKNSTLGASFYLGDHGQNDPAFGRSQVLLGALHGEITVGHFNGKAMWTEGSLSDTDRIAARTGQVLGNRVRGGYLILSYDVLPGFAPIARKFVPDPPPPAWRQLPLFVSYEYEDLNAEVEPGLVKDPALRSDIYTVGFNFHPHPQVVIKADFAKETNRAGRDARVVETAIGFVF